MKRTIAIAAALVGLVVLVPTAAASDTSDTTTAPPADTPTTTVPEEPTTTSTEVPVTTTSTEVPTTTTTTTSIPTTGVDAPCLADCIPVAEACTGPECIPTGAGGIPTAIGGAGALPFTGIEDMIAPILLALTVVLGGVVAWRWARLRESVAEAAQRARALPAREARSAFKDAIRDLEIEQRARQVFTPRVA